MGLFSSLKRSLDKGLDKVSKELRVYGENNTTMLVAIDEKLAAIIKLLQPEEEKPEESDKTKT